MFTQLTLITIWKLFYYQFGKSPTVKIKSNNSSLGKPLLYSPLNNFSLTPQFNTINISEYLCAYHVPDIYSMCILYYIYNTDFIYIYIIQMTRKLQTYVQSVYSSSHCLSCTFITIKIKISYHFDKKANPMIHLNYYIIFSSNL